MKKRFLITILILFMVFSCRAQKTAKPVEQDLTATETIETPELSGNINESQVTTGSTPINDVIKNLYMMKDDIDKALQVWNRAKTYPFYIDSIGTIVFGNGRFVAKGSLSIPLAYSDDGDTWHKVENNVFERESIHGMAFGKGRFVAATYGDDMAYSDDGETWTLAENGGLGDYYIMGIAYGADCFVAVGSTRHELHGIIGYSDDGETWTLVEDGSLGIEIFNCITYGNGIFIAGGNEGKAAYSSDGKTWKAMPGGPFEDLDVRILAYGNERFVAFCSYFQGYNSTIYYSDNGIDWAVVSDGPDLFAVYNIVYVNGIFIAVSHSATMSYSIDGKTWSPRLEIEPLVGTGDNLGGIAYGNGRIVIGCGNGLSRSSRIAWCDMPEIVDELP